MSTEDWFWSAVGVVGVVLLVVLLEVPRWRLRYWQRQVAKRRAAIEAIYGAPAGGVQNDG